MLQRLSIKNVALIDSADISFSDGLNVLSGETGAGKSVILDSVNFVLGAKADRSMIRYGETECMVKAEFSVSEDSLALAELREMDIESDGEIVISRRFSDSGKNAIKINGNTVTATMLRRVTDFLVDVHGQSEHFYLLSESNQLKTLDEVVGNGLTELKESLLKLLQERKDVDERISMLGGSVAERGRRLDILRYEIDEIEAVGLKDGEEEELLAKRNKINHLEKIISVIKEATGAMSGEGGVYDGIGVAKRAVGSIARLDDSYAELAERLESLLAEADDIAETLSDMGSELYFDERESEETESRLDSIRSLKRKYGGSFAEINEYLQKSKEEFELLSDCEGQYEILTTKRKKVLKEIYQLCLRITELRKKKGLEFCKRVTEELKTLNIQSAAFDIEFKEYTEEDAERANGNGLDSVCFLFSANAGEPLKPLGKIISGGEMSRFMLALKTQLKGVNGICTYIFDEIDAGISGKTAKVVGEKFARIAQNTQIIAVSHLAQIASMSDLSLLIEKKEENGKTHTQVKTLSETEKTLEIVRLLGGENEDGIAKRHAEEMIKQANEYKNAIN